MASTVVHWTNGIREYVMCFAHVCRTAHSKSSTINEREREREKWEKNGHFGEGKRREKNVKLADTHTHTYVVQKQIYCVFFLFLLLFLMSVCVHFKQSFGLTWFYLNSAKLNFMHWIKLVVKVVTILISFSQQQQKKTSNSHFHSSSLLSVALWFAPFATRNFFLCQPAPDIILFCHFLVSIFI